MEYNLSQQCLEATFPKCQIHKMQFSSSCIKSDCKQFLKAECQKCLQDHPDHQNKFNQGLNILLENISILQQQNQKQQNPGGATFQKNLIEISKQMKILGQQLFSISDKLYQQSQIQLENQDNNIEEILKNILQLSQKQEMDLIQKFQLEIQKFSTHLDFSDPNQIKMKSFNKNNLEIQGYYYVKVIKEQLTQIDSILNTLQKQSETNIKELLKNEANTIFDHSNLLVPENSQIIKEWFKKDIQLKLIYQASKDGFDQKTFHTKCDLKGPTFVVIKSEFKQIFGGYANSSWNDSEQDINDSACFLFSISKKEKFNLKPGRAKYAMKGKVDDYMILFGTQDGSDILISNNSNNNQESLCNFGNNYQCPVTIKDEQQQYLAGKYRFKTLEIEVFLVQSLY